MFSDTDIIKMLEFICNIYFYIGVGVFKIVDISVVTNCAPLLTELFRYSYEADLISYRNFS